METFQNIILSLLEYDTYNYEENPAPSLFSSNYIPLSLEFTKFKINIKHQLINDLGEFSIFCLKAISEGCTLQDLSDITLLKPEFIHFQLSFLRDRQYLNQDNKLTQKGERLVKILEFLEKYGSSIEVYTDNYIENQKYKKIIPLNLIDNLPKDSLADTVYIKPLIKSYRLTKILNSEDFKDKLINYLKETISDYKELIEEEESKLTIEAEYVEYIKATVKFEVEKIVSSISLTKQEGLAIAIPVVVLETKSYLNSENKKIKEKFQDWIDNNKNLFKKKVFNLLSGSQFDTVFEFKDKTPQNIPTLVRKVELEELNIYEMDITIPREVFPYMKIENYIQEGYTVGYIPEEKLSKLLEETLFNVGV